MTEQTERLPIKAHELSPPLKVTRIESLDQMAPLLDFFSRCNGVLGWDLETTPLKDFYFRRCRTIQFGDQHQQYVIDLLSFCEGNPELLRDAQGEYGKNLGNAPKLKELLELIRPILCTKDYLKVGVSLGFEYMSFYWLFGQRAFHFFDCSVVEKCIWAGAHSLKDYGFFSMESMMDRYFKVLIDKELQTSFNLTDPLSDEQVAYAALDTRFPIGIKAAQTLILQGQTVKGLQAKGNLAWKTLDNIDPVVTGDNLLEIAKIENDAIGAFQDMHVHGERIDRTKWFTRTAAKKEEMKALISDVLDPIFLPIVGSKLDGVTDEEIEEAQTKWKSFNNVTDAELQLKSQIRAAKKNDPDSVPALEASVVALTEGRKAEKEQWKQAASEMSKKRTKIKNLAAKCEGNALINYGSDAQLLAILKTMKGLKTLTGLDDEILGKYEHIPVMAAIRRYHGLAKEIGTYGDQWALEWLTKPCKEEGWLHPGDGRLHGVFNQYDAETGRSSSEKPNCFSDDTEVLTYGGWKLFKDVSRGDTVAQYDRDTGEIDFTFPTAFIAQRGPDYMLHLKSDLFIDMLVTPDHNMPLRNRRSFRWKTFKADSYREDAQQVVAGFYRGGRTNYTPEMITVMCALQADAHVSKRGLDWSFTKTRKVQRLISALDKCGIEYTYSIHDGTRHRVRVFIDSVPGWLQRRKVWTDDVLTFDLESLSFLSEEIYHWDGCLNKGSMYSSSVKKNTDWMQIVSLLTGKRANVREYHNGNPNSVVNYQIDVTRRDYSLTNNVSRTLVPYTGEVYCVTMPKGTVVVRRNGVPAITGNCQNLPQDKEIRSCFIADPPNDNIRISTCCGAECGHIVDHDLGIDRWRCIKCNKHYELGETSPEEYILVTADMSGAELRIIAELANDPVWIVAFERGEDVHSVCTELLYAEEWPKLALPDCAYYRLKENGEPQRHKCKCPEHNELRNATKAVNFLLAYGGGPYTLAARIGKSVEEAKKLMAIHELRFPRIWEYLTKSGRRAKMLKKSFDMFGRRRLFPEPTHERAIEKAKSDREEKLLLDEAEAHLNVEKFMTTYMRKPNPEELWILTHRQPSQKEISNAMIALASSIERQGKNHCIQGTNASIAKLAMSCGYSPYGKPYLWHILPVYRAKLIKFVHDELVIQAPKHLADKVAAEVQDAFMRAAKEKMSRVVMESEFSIAGYWKK